MPEAREEEDMPMARIEEEEEKEEEEKDEVEKEEGETKFTPEEREFLEKIIDMLDARGEEDMPMERMEEEQPMPDAR